MVRGLHERFSVAVRISLAVASWASSAELTFANAALISRAVPSWASVRAMALPVVLEFDP